MDSRLPGSSVHGILQARILKWVAIPFSKGTSGPRDWSCISYRSPALAGKFFTTSAALEAQSAYKLNKQSNSKQPWCTYSFPNFEPICCSVLVLSVASWLAYRFLKRQVRQSDILIFFRIFLSLLSSTRSILVINEAEVDVFFSGIPLLFLWSNGCSSAFSKPNLCIWKLLVLPLLKTSLKNFEHKLASMWNEHNCMVVEHSLALLFFGIGMKTDLQSSGHCWVISICWHIEFSSLTTSSFRIWNSSAEILSHTHPLHPTSFACSNAS